MTRQPPVPMTMKPTYTSFMALLHDVLEQGYRAGFFREQRPVLLVSPKDARAIPDNHGELSRDEMATMNPLGMLDGKNRYFVRIRKKLPGGSHIIMDVQPHDKDTGNCLEQ